MNTSKPTEGEVPPAGCAGVVCANETNKKKIEITALRRVSIEPLAIGFVADYATVLIWAD